MSRLDEVKRLQKIAGILKESVSNDEDDWDEAELGEHPFIRFATEAFLGVLRKGQTPAEQLNTMGNAIKPNGKYAKKALSAIQKMGYKVQIAGNQYTISKGPKTISVVYTGEDPENPWSMA